MNPSPLPVGVEEPKIDFSEYFAIFRKHRSFLLSIVVLCTALAILTAMLLPKKYEATMLLAAATEASDSSGLSSLANQFGSLASLAGVALDSGGSKEEAVAILRSRSLALEFIEQENLLPVFFSDRWDRDSGKWAVNQDEIPSMWDAMNYFEERVRRVAIRKDDGLVVLSITWFEPDVAALWASRLVALVNQKMRSDAIQEATQSIEYLNQELSKTSAIELQQGIYRLIESNLNTIMLANVRDEFAFRVLDDAATPDSDDFSSPDRAMIIFLGFMLGVIAGLGGSLIRNALLRRIRGESQ